ncbi:MAG: AsmA family protein [Thermodesulfobacteriota bacterium]
MIKWKHQIKSSLRFFGGVSLIFIIVVAILFIAPDSAYQRLLTWTVQKFTDYRVIIDGQFSVKRSLMPTMTISDFRIKTDQTGVQPFSTHIGKLKIKLDIKALLSGVVLFKELLAEDTTISFITGEGVRSQKSAEQEPVKTLNDIDIPIFESVKLKNVNVSYFDKDTEFSLQLNLRSFLIDDVRDKGILHVRGEGTMNNANFAINGQLGSLADALERIRPYPVDLKLNVADLIFTLSGTVDDPVEGEGLNLHVAAEEAELSKILNVLKLDVSKLGRLNLKGTIIGRVEAPGVSDLKVSISGGTDMEFSAKGSAANLISGGETDIAISVSSSNRDVIRMLFPDEYHDLSEFTFKGRLSYLHEDYKLEDVIFSASHGKGTTLRANGGLVLGDNLFSPEVKKTDLKLYLTAQDTKPLKLFLFDWLPDIGPVIGEARLIGPVEQLALENLNITAGESKTVRINAKGHLGRIPVNSDSQVSGIDMSLSIESEEATLLFSGLDVSIPELDSVSASARMHGNGDNLLFDEIKVQMTDPGGVTAEVSGSASLEQRENKSPLGKFDLDVNITAESIKSFRRLLEAKILPDLGPVHASTHVTGTTEIMAMESFVLKAGHPGPVRFEMSGRIGKVVFEGDQPFSEVDLVSHSYAEKSSDLSPLLGIVLPDLGAIEMTLRIVNRKEGYGADNIEYIIGTKDNILLKGTGSVEYLMRGTSVAMEGISQSVEIRDLDAQAFSGLLGQQISRLGKLKGSFSVSGSMNDLSVSDADLLMTSPEGLEIKVQGDVKHIRAESDRPVDGIDVKLSVKATDAAVIGSILGRQLPFSGLLAIEGQVRSDKEELSLNGEINIGNTHILVTAERSPVNQQSRIIVEFSAPKVYLEDIGIYPKTLPDSSVPTEKSVSETDVSIFTEEPLPFELLRKIDLSLSLDVNEVIGKDFILKDLDVDVSMDDGFLRMSPARMTYADGFVSVEFTVDTRGSEPEITLNATAEDIEVAALLSYVHMPIILGGHLNLAVDLHGTGSSPRKIAAGLNGELVIAIEHGQIKQIADLMGADAIDFVTTARKLGTYQKLNCLVLNFEFDNGIGNSQVIYIDTHEVRSQGKGTVNLRDETIDIVIQPKPKKKRLGGSSPVAIQGPLSSPSARKLPLKEAAKLSGEILLPYVFLSARALGYVWYLMKDDKDEQSPCFSQDS